MKLTKQDTKNWNAEIIICHAVIIGMEYAANHINKQQLQHDKKILVERIKAL